MKKLTFEEIMARKRAGAEAPRDADALTAAVQTKSPPDRIDTKRAENVLMRYVEENRRKGEALLEEIAAAAEPPETDSPAKRYVD